MRKRTTGCSFEKGQGAIGDVRWSSGGSAFSSDLYTPDIMLEGLGGIRTQQEPCGGPIMTAFPFYFTYDASHMPCQVYCHCL